MIFLEFWKVQQQVKQLGLLPGIRPRHRLQLYRLAQQLEEMESEYNRPMNRPNGVIGGIDRSIPKGDKVKNQPPDLTAGEFNRGE